MGKKLTNSILFIAVFAAAVVMTIYVGQDAVSVLVYYMRCLLYWRFWQGI